MSATRLVFNRGVVFSRQY